MKDFVLILLCVVVIFVITGCSVSPEQAYDPNDQAYKFIPPAPDEWVEKFGDTERTRLIHSISELRVITAKIAAKVNEIDKWRTEPDEKEELK